MFISENCNEISLRRIANDRMLSLHLFCNYAKFVIIIKVQGIGEGKFMSGAKSIRIRPAYKETAFCSLLSRHDECNLSCESETRDTDKPANIYFQDRLKFVNRSKRSLLTVRTPKMENFRGSSMIHRQPLCFSHGQTIPADRELNSNLLFVLSCLNGWLKSTRLSCHGVNSILQKIYETLMALNDGTTMSISSTCRLPAPKEENDGTTPSSKNGNVFGQVDVRFARLTTCNYDIKILLVNLRRW